MAANKKYYPYQGKEITLQEAHQIYGTALCSSTWLRIKLKEHPLEEVLSMRPSTNQQNARKASRKSTWRKTNPALFEKEDVEDQAPFLKHQYVKRMMS